MSAGHDSQSAEEKWLKENAGSFHPETFTPGAATPIAAFLLGLIFIAGAGAFFFGSYSLLRADLAEMDRFEIFLNFVVVGIAAVMGVLLGVLGIIAIRWAPKLMRQEVELQEGGFRDFCDGETAFVPWTEVQLIVETISHERLPITSATSGIPSPKVASRSFIVHATQDRRFRYTGDNVLKLKRFTELLVNRAERYSIPWQTVEVGR